MSSLGGIHNFNGTPIDNRVLGALGDALAVRGPDAGDEVCSTSVGIAYRGFHTNQESRLETQPFISRNKHILAWDGRLDNRKELISELRHSLEDDTTDVAIVMAAYLEWGMDFLPKLIGDFSLSLWDPFERRLVLARDPVGTRPLYYHLNTNRIVWSSELVPLVNLAGIRLEVNDEYIAGYLAYEPDPWLTPYKNVQALAPGHVLNVLNGQVSQHEFWKLDPHIEIRYKTDADYEEHFRHLFREAVQCRLRADGPVWAELSGGLDSSSIVCMADHIIKSGDVQTAELKTVSQVFDESADSDERKFIQCVEQQRGKTGLYLCEDDYRLLAFVSDRSLTRTLNPFLYAGEYHQALYEAMSEDGARVILCGRGGDEMLSSSMDPSPELADLLFELNLAELHRRLQIWSRTLKKPYLKVLWQNAVIPLLPPQIQVAFRRGENFEMPQWFNAQFASRMCMRERMLVTKDVFGCRTPSSRDQATGFISVVRGIATGYRREIAKVEVSYPFTHIPLVEFLQAIPFNQRVRPGETRSLMRRSLRALLPEKIAARKGKGKPGGAICRAFAREWPRLQQLFKDASICSRGYADYAGLKLEIEKTSHGSGTHSVPLIKAIALEIWLRTFESQDGLTEINTSLARVPASEASTVFLGETL
jgi:asparagine synthase (glutamine-hydrolysing)